MTKIHIIGGPGSGKSSVAKVLSKRLKLPVFDLDDLFWNKGSAYHGSQNTPERRSELLRQILDRDDWIIEGVHHSWLEESFRKADYIYILKTNKGIRGFRLFKKFVMRKLRLIPSPRRETLRTFIELLRFNHQYDGNNLVQAVKMLKAHKDKVIILTKDKDIYKTIRKKKR